MARFWRRRPGAARKTTEERVERVPPPPPSPIWPWLVLLLVVVLGALGAAWYFASRDETVEAERVPSVVGLEQVAAERRLDDRGFESEVKRVVSSRPPGNVTAQRPDEGTLYGEGGIVVISVSRSPLDVEVPKVVGLRVGAALARLRGAGLNPRAQNVQSRRPQGIVLRQVPMAGTDVPRDSAAVVIVSAGPQLADVPDILGRTAEEATAQLTRAGFRTRVQQVASPEPEGRVIAQEPAGGTRAQRGRVVRITVSRGEGQTTTVVTTTAGSQTTVPDVVGQDEATATLAVENDGFRVRVTNRTVTEPSEDGIVLQQLPRGGVTRRAGSTVTIVVGKLR
jgi:eukaryotic-like serine/threonine-protein kinase